MTKKKVALLMSGGIDSSYSAFLLKQNYEVQGIYLQLHNRAEKNDFFINRCKKVVQNLGIDFCVIDLRSEFREKVYDYFIDSYKNAQTPNPCAMCNPNIKFGLGLERALDLECDFIASGHYAQIAQIDGKNYIKEAVDKSKDQSYFLFGISQFAKDRLIFPLGDKLKENVKKEAFAAMPWLNSALGELEDYKDSQEICFVEKDYIDTLKKEIDIEKQGVVKDMQGNKIGTHKGYMQYTIGKRKGLNIPLAMEAQYVVAIDAKKNEIMVGGMEDLLKREIVAKSLTPCDLDDGEYSIKIRSSGKAIKAQLSFESYSIHAKLLEPAYSVAEGQGLVIYKDDIVLGGGFIESSL